MLLTPAWLWCNATAPDLFPFKGKMNPPVCIWAFLLLNSIRKHIKTSGPYQPVSFTCQKPERSINSQNSLQLNRTLLFFFFFSFGAWLFWSPQQRAWCSHFVCGCCLYQQSLKSGVPWHCVEKTHQWQQAAEMFGCSCSHLPPLPLSHSSRNYHGATLAPWSPSGKSQIISHSARSKGKGCIYHKIALQWLYPCCWAPSNLQCSSLLCRKEKAQIVTFYSFPYRIKILV